MFLMASVINTARPFSIMYRDPEDTTLYQEAKLLLHEMVSVGNMASRGHLKSLEELEKTRELIIGQIQPSAAHGLVLPDLDVDIDNWLEMLNASPTDSSTHFGAWG